MVANGSFDTSNVFPPKSTTLFALEIFLNQILRCIQMAIRNARNRVQVMEPSNQMTNYVSHSKSNCAGNVLVYKSMTVDTNIGAHPEKGRE